MVLSVVPTSSTPPQPGHSTFHDSSKMPSRDAGRKAAIAHSSSRPCRLAKASGLTRQRSRSDASRTASSIAEAQAGFDDCRRTLKRASFSLIEKLPARQRVMRKVMIARHTRKTKAGAALGGLHHGQVKGLSERVK